MAANINPLYPLTFNTKSVTLSTANTARDGSGVLYLGFTASVNGSRLDRIIIYNTPSQVSGAASIVILFRIFISDTTGSNYKLYRECSISGALTNTVNGSNGPIVNLDISINLGILLSYGQQIAYTLSQINTTSPLLTNFCATSEGVNF